MDLCGSVKVTSKGGKKYILVIVYDYSSFTWTFFLRYKEETFTVFEAFSRHFQVKYNGKIIGIKSDHRIKFENSKFNQFCT